MINGRREHGVLHLWERRPRPLVPVAVPLDTGRLDARDAALLHRPVRVRQQLLDLLRLGQLARRVQPDQLDVQLRHDVRERGDGALRPDDEPRQQEVALAHQRREGARVEGRREALQLAQVAARQLDADDLGRRLRDVGDDVRVEVDAGPDAGEVVDDDWQRRLLRDLSRVSVSCKIDRRIE